tara:strand:- start:63 stop:1487 length:1425 start_codon:yes stop_codon:yes gene_type:complete
MAAASVIEQQPLLATLPVGQEIIFVVSNTTAVAVESNVKFIAEIFISDSSIPNFATTPKAGTFKTTPNNAGVGIFDLRNVVENYVKADNVADNFSQYKLVTTTANTRHPLHLINKFSTNSNGIRFMVIRFSVEYLGATDNAGNQSAIVVRQQAGTEISSVNFTIFNGYLKYTDILNTGTVATNSAQNFGFNVNNLIPSGSTDSFLTNAPVNQYANLEDYGTVGLLVPVVLTKMRFTYYATDGSTSTEDVDKTLANGAFTVFSAFTKNYLLYFGCFPANLQNWSSTFNALVTAGTIQGGYYTVQGFDGIGIPRSKIYTINVNCPNQKNYESIRLCWLNQWGAWDYYTFTKKSSRKFNTKGTTFTQLEGTWNESVYRIDGFKGGKRTFNMNTTERITMNSDFVSEDDNVMFEELINSPEVYLLQGFQADLGTALNQYATPVRLMTKSFSRKTVANDRLIQYKFQIEKSKTLRTQSI